MYLGQKIFKEAIEDMSSQKGIFFLIKKERKDLEEKINDNHLSKIFYKGIGALRPCISFLFKHLKSSKCLNWFYFLFFKLYNFLFLFFILKKSLELNSS